MLTTLAMARRALIDGLEVLAIMQATNDTKDGNQAGKRSSSHGRSSLMPKTWQHHVTRLRRTSIDLGDA